MRNHLEIATEKFLLAGAHLNKKEYFIQSCEYIQVWPPVIFPEFLLKLHACFENRRHSATQTLLVLIREDKEFL